MATIADILTEQGRMLADARRRRGERAGSIVAALGQIPGQIMADRAAQRQLAEQQAAQAAEMRRRDAIEARAAAAEAREAAAAEAEQQAAQQAAARRQQIDAVLAQPGVIEEATGAIKLPTALNVARKMGFTGIAQEIAGLAQKNPKVEAPRTREIKTTAPDGTETIHIVEDRPGFSTTSTPKPKEVTFSAPQPYMLNGRRILARAGSDNRMYDMQGQPIANALAPDVPPVRESIAANPLDTRTEWAIPPGETEARLMTEAEIRQTGAKRPAGADKPSSGQQKRVLNFFNRAQQADADLESMEEQIQQLSLGGQTWQALAPNFAQTQLGQAYTQAQRAFTEARLRKDSGAAIPKEEFESDRKTYFAQPGDSKETLEQKRRARGAMLASLGFESGQALAEFLGDTDEAKRVVEEYKARATGKATTAGGPKEGDTKPIPGFPGTEQTFKNGKWIRTK